jgi:hypothetical protein
MKNKIHNIIVLFLVFAFNSSFAQNQVPATNTTETPKPANHNNTIEEMKLKLNDDGSHYLKWTLTNQVWFRYNESNPGTTAVGVPAKETFDIGLRRTRVQFFGQITDHVFFYTQFGQNNFNYLAGYNAAGTGNRKFQVFFHDALGEYKIWKSNDWLKLGGGLTITNGLSRFSQPSIGTITTMDVPVFAQATVDQTDEFSRKLSVYARGQVGKFDYRIVLSDPFPVASNGSTPASVPKTIVQGATFAQVGHHKQYQGYFIYNFFDKEAHTLPYMTGTYLGKKKVLNLEAGFITQAKATWTRETPISDTTYYNMKLFSAAVFYDAPVNTEKGTAISAYAGYFNLNYGKNYLRYNGTMNPASGLPASGYIGGSQGNAFPMFGTGQVIYAQAGYLFKKDLLGEGNGTLMPYASIMSADFDKVKHWMNVYDIGINWFLKGHTSKFSLDFQHRPVYTTGGGTQYVKNGAKGQIVLQYQISI